MARSIEVWPIGRLRMLISGWKRVENREIIEILKESYVVIY